MTAAARHTDEVVVYPTRRFLTMNRIQSRRRASQYCGGIGEDVTQPGNGSAALPAPISTPSFDAAPYFTGDWAGCGARKWARRRTLPETNVPSPEIDAEN